MKIVVYGTGAIGGFYGAQLARSGRHEVHFVARGRSLEALRREGLHLKSDTEDLSVSLDRVQCTDDPATIGPADLVLLSVKSYDTGNVAPSLGSLMKENTTVLSMQNGVENGEVLAGTLAREQILAGVLFLNVSLEAPGRVRHHYGNRLVIGGIDAAGADAAQRIQGELSRSGIAVEVSPRIEQALWLKLIWNASYNALTCLTGCSIRELFELEETNQLARAAMVEGTAVAQACGLTLSEQGIEMMLAHTARMGDIPTSMLTDRRNGRPLEVEAISGVLVRQGKKHGIPTPINATLYGMLKSIDRKHRASSAGAVSHG